jgi:hypothetical protein
VASDVAWVSLVALVGGPGACELCAADVLERGYAVVVRHPRGGAVQFAACDRCTAAVRRLAAATGGRAHFAVTEGAAPPPAEVEGVARAAPAPDVVARPELVHDFSDVIRDADGTEYVIRAYGQPREDGTWIGWLEFVAVGADTVLRTGQETTQPNHADLLYWARGLEPTYLEGAFARARRLAASAGPGA